MSDIYSGIPDHWAGAVPPEGEHFGPRPENWPVPILTDDAGDSDQWEMYREGSVD